MSKYIKLEDALTAFAEACKGKVLKVLSDHQIIKAFRDNINNLPTIEVSEDCISREYILGEAFAANEYNRETKSFDLPVVSVRDIEDAPSVVPKQVTGKLADEDIAKVSELKDTMKDAVIKLDRPKGEWRHTSTTSLSKQCSICGATFNNVVLVKGGTSTATPNDILYNFCPYCGADMREEARD